MIDLVKSTPYEYSKQSRDYQILARLLSILYNSSKSFTNRKVWNDLCDDRLLTLKGRTLNFVADHYWESSNLRAIISCFKYLVKNKGSNEAFRACITILTKIMDVDVYLQDRSNPFTIDVDNKTVIIKVAAENLEWGVLEDLVKYILPIGYTYRIITYKVSSDKGFANTNLEYIDDKVSGEPFNINPGRYILDKNGNEFVFGKLVFGDYKTKAETDRNHLFIYSDEKEITNGQGEI